MERRSADPGSVATAQAAGLNPYVGPRPFTGDDVRDGRLFCGRDREAGELLDLLISKRIVLLYSPSGAGKTSLIQASLIPLLEQEEFEVLPPIRVGLEPPARAAGLGSASSLNRYLYSTLHSLNAEPPEDVTQGLAGPAGLSLTAYLQQRPRAEGKPLLLIFDQFEEVLTADPTDQEVKAAFFNELGAVLRDRERWALFAMREDYVAALDRYLPLLPTRLSATFRLDLLEAAARRAIQEPARAAGVTFADAAAQALVDDLRLVRVQRADGSIEPVPGSYVEPVQLQVACVRIWQQLPPGATEISDLTHFRNVDQALSDFYGEEVQTVAERTGVAERAIREWFDRRLITPQGLRSQVLKEAEQSQDLDNEAIEQLVDAHLVRAEQRRGLTWFELAHDRLIVPVRENNTAWFQRHLSALQRQSVLWNEQDRPDRLLLKDPELAEAERWAATHDDELTDVDRLFLAACRQASAAERERRRAARFRGAAIGLSVVLVLVAGFAGLSQALLAARNSASSAKATAISAAATAESAAARAASAAAGANVATIGFLTQAAKSNETGQLDLALLLSIEANRLADTVQADHAIDPASSVATARNGLVQAMTLSPRLSGFLRGHPAQVSSVAFSSDGKTLASWSCATPASRGPCAESETRFWDLASRQQIGRSMSGPTALITSVAFSPDRKTLATGGRDGSIVLWNITTGGVLGQPLTVHTGAVISMAFSPDGKTLASGSADKSIIFWDATDPSHLRALGPPLTGHLSSVNSVAFTPDGKTLASGSCGLPSGPGSCRQGEVRLWDAETRQPIAQLLSGQTDAVTTVAFSPDGKVLASGSLDDTIVIWNVTDPTQARQLGKPLKGHTLAVNSIAFNPDGKILASGSADKSIILWDVATGRQLGGPLTGHTAAVAAVAFSPDGKTLASGSADTSVILWNVTNPTAPRQFGQSLIAHTAAVTTVAFSPDGKMLASGGADTIVVLQDLTGNWQRDQILVGHTLVVNSVAFSPDGKTLASGSDDGSVILWDVTGENAETAPARVCRIAGRNLSTPEWSQYLGSRPYHKTCPQFP